MQRLQRRDALRLMSAGGLLLMTDEWAFGADQEPTKEDKAAIERARNAKTKFAIQKNRMVDSPAGWWIKICTQQTKATTIHFAAWEKDEGSKLVRFDWVSGQTPDEFELPFLNAFEKVYLFAESEGDKQCYVGLCHKKTICCKHYDFHKNERHDVKAGDSDEWKCT